MADRADFAALRLLLLLARRNLSAEQRERAHGLCLLVEDWDALIKVASTTFGLPLAYRHLSRLEVGAVPEQALRCMHDHAMRMAARTLRVEAAHRAFQVHCLSKLGVRHVFFKGMSLAARYYETLNLRPCRDIDVLVEERRIPELVQLALRAGYRSPSEQPTATERDIAVLCRYASVVELVSPNGIMIELHKSLDREHGHFDSRALLAKSEQIHHADLPISVLPTAELFVYVCQHHTRHFWSHLHWLADLDAIHGHPSFDLAEVESVARQTGMTATVAACLELRTIVEASDAEAGAEPDSRGGELLRHAMICFSEGTGREMELRQAILGRGVLPFDWQSSALHRLKVWLARKFFLLKPWPADYAAWPLPLSLHGVYYFTRPLRLLWRRLSNGAEGH